MGVCPLPRPEAIAFKFRLDIEKRPRALCVILGCLVVGCFGRGEPEHPVLILPVKRAEEIVEAGFGRKDHDHSEGFEAPLLLALLGIEVGIVMPELLHDRRDAVDDMADL